MLSQAGLQRGKDYKEVLLDGFDPVAQLKTSIDALPVYKSNEPGQLDRAGVKYRLFDPADYGIPGTFGVIYTTPVVPRPAPDGGAGLRAGRVQGLRRRRGRPGRRRGHLDQGDQRRRQPELPDRRGRDVPLAAGVGHRGRRARRAGELPGLIDPGVFAAEVDAYAKAGVFPNGTPSTDGTYDADVANGVVSGTTLVWPAAPG